MFSPVGGVASDHVEVVMSLMKSRGIFAVVSTRNIIRSFSNNVKSTEINNSNKYYWLLAIPVTTFCLGTWQIFRLQWKINLIDELERRTMRPPIAIPYNILNRVDELEYRKVILSGYFDHTKEILMWPRVQLNEPMGIKRNNEPGAFVITPFYCYQTQSFILVNRGWVPRNKMDPDTRASGQVKGDVELTAIVRSQESRAPFSPKNNPEANYWAWRDLEAMSKYVGSDPVLVDADITTTVPGGPIGGQTKVTLRNEHLQYVFTWYALSLATFYLFWQFWKKVKKRRL